MKKSALLGAGILYGLTSLANPAYADSCRDNIQKLDLNSDGEITLNEFGENIMMEIPLLEKLMLFRKYGVTYKVLKEEIKKVAEELFPLLDKNGDGRATLAEICQEST